MIATTFEDKKGGRPAGLTHCSIHPVTPLPGARQHLPALGMGGLVQSKLEGKGKGRGGEGRGGEGRGGEGRGGERGSLGEKGADIIY